MADGLTVRFKGEYARIEFAEEAWEKMWYIVSQVKGEVGWLGRVKRLAPFVFRVEEIFLPPQDANGATTEMQPEDLVEFLTALQAERGDDIVNELNCHCHSHADMGVFRSGQDEKMWNEWIEATGKRPFIAIRANKKGDITAEVSIPDLNLILEGVTPELEELPEAEQPWRAELDALIKTNVREYSSKWLKGSRGSKGDYNRGRYGFYRGSDYYQPGLTDGFNYGDYDWPGTVPAKDAKKLPEPDTLDIPGLMAALRPNIDYNTDKANWSEQQAIAARCGIAHYNSLTTQYEREAWKELTGEVFEILTFNTDAEMRGSEEAVAGWIADELAMAFKANSFLATAKGWAFVRKYALRSLQGDKVVVGK